MTTEVQATQPLTTNRWRIAGWGSAAALLLTPLIAMQFTREVAWDETDFVVAAILFGIVGVLIELAVRASPNWPFRFGAFFAVLAGFMLVWANLAVGLIGNEDNPVNLLFGAVLAIAIAGTVRSRWLAPAMLAAGMVQFTIGLFAGVLGTDPRGGVFTIVIALPWFLSAALLRRAAGRS